MMLEETIFITLTASLLSGLFGALASSYFYIRLERRKIKLDTARKLFGNRYNISNTLFKEALNEIVIVFSDSQGVIDKVEEFFKITELPKHARSDESVAESLTKLMKAICCDLGIKYKNLPESYYLKYFGVDE